MIALGGHHSLSTDIISTSTVSHDSGLIGWVAKHGRSIHVSPFEHDSRTLGIYSENQELKSFIGIPIELPEIPSAHVWRTGVIACDSKKSFAFSKLQGKLLEGLAFEIANTIRLASLAFDPKSRPAGFNTFLDAGCELGHSLGYLSLEVLRLRQTNFDLLEMALGTSKAIELTEQVYRLVQQALPPHFPFSRLPNGDIVLIIDTMMASFIENKVRAICQHVAIDGKSVDFRFIRNPARKKKERSVHIERLIIDTAPADPARVPGDQALDFEYRRA